VHTSTHHARHIALEKPAEVTVVEEPVEHASHRWSAARRANVLRHVYPTAQVNSAALMGVVEAVVPVSRLWCAVRRDNAQRVHPTGSVLNGAVV